MPLFFINSVTKRTNPAHAVSLRRLRLCPADIDGNCTVGASDLLILLTNWG